MNSKRAAQRINIGQKGTDNDAAFERYEREDVNSSPIEPHYYLGKKRVENRDCKGSSKLSHPKIPYITGVGADYMKNLTVATIGVTSPVMSPKAPIVLPKLPQ